MFFKICNQRELLIHKTIDARVGFPKAVDQPIREFQYLLHFGARITKLLVRFFLKFAGIHLLRDIDLVSTCGRYLLVGFDDEIWHNVVGLKMKY
jgi:hypothetical protein